MGWPKVPGLRLPDDLLGLTIVDERSVHVPADNHQAGLGSGRDHTFVPPASDPRPNADFGSFVVVSAFTDNLHPAAFDVSQTTTARGYIRLPNDRDASATESPETLSSGVGQRC